MHGVASRKARLVVAGCLALAAVRCTGTRSVQPRAPREFSRSLQLNGATLRLHLAPGLPVHQRLLLVYATGDGGWRGKDRDVFLRLQSWGYQVAGFSAPEYLAHLPGREGTTTPARVGADYARIIDEARGLLHLPTRHRVVLVGVSRGADLAVVAAGQPGLQPALDGVVVMGLTREEEYVRRRRAPGALELYPYLPRLRDLPVSVIQSTRDTYLPASEARLLFGADTPLRELHPIDARNHSFGGARDRLYDALRASLAWVDGRSRLPVH